MRMIRSKKVALGVLGAGAAVMVLGSAAFACVPFKGDLTVTGPTNGNLVTGDGSTSQHVYCSGRKPTTAAAAGFNQSITVTVDPATACTGAGNQLADGNNSVIINNPTSSGTTTPFTLSGGVWTFLDGTGCFRSGITTNKTLSTTFNVTSGSGSASYTLPHMNRIDPTNEASALCVGVSGGSGIIAPIRITSI